MKRVGVLFVCLGNICRSPVARAVFQNLVNQAGQADRIFSDSCGTGNWHVGGPADYRSVAIAQHYNVPMRHIARQLSPNDQHDFDYAIAMDQANVRDIIAAGVPRSKVHLLRSFDPAVGQSLRLNAADQSTRESHPMLQVPDPYHGSPDDFHAMYHQIMPACQGLLLHIQSSLP
jgi:protein-tyrosine phosphatase